MKYLLELIRVQILYAPIIANISRNVLKPRQKTSNALLGIFHEIEREGNRPWGKQGGKKFAKPRNSVQEIRQTCHRERK